MACILLEHQTKADWRTPLITLIYAALYWEWQLRQWEEHKPPRPDFLLRPILPIVLHTGALPWGTVKTLRELLVEPEAFRPFLPDWKPLLWERAQHSTAELLDSRSAFVQVLALLRAETQERHEAERTFLSALNQVGTLHDTNYRRWQDLVQFIIGWAQHRRPIEERADWQATAEQFQTDEQRKGEIDAMGMTIVQGIYAEGKTEGKAEALRGVLLRQGRKKFGEPDETMLRILQSIADVDRLDRMSDAIDEAKSWADLLNGNGVK